MFVFKIKIADRLFRKTAEDLIVYYLLISSLIAPLGAWKIYELIKPYLELVK